MRPTTQSVTDADEPDVGNGLDPATRTQWLAWAFAKLAAKPPEANQMRYMMALDDHLSGAASAGEPPPGLAGYVLALMAAEQRALASDHDNTPAEPAAHLLGTDA